MSQVKLCGLSRSVDIEVANTLLPEYIGFIFWPCSKRYVTPQKAQELKTLLSPQIKAVGVFVDEDVNLVAELLNKDIVDIAQLHGGEDEGYISLLRSLSDKPIIKAFQIKSADDIPHIESSSADYVLIDSGTGTGATFDWSLIKNITRPYFLAGGLGLDNVDDARRILNPFALDVSSGIETDGLKDSKKMVAFVNAARKEI